MREADFMRHAAEEKNPVLVEIAWQYKAQLAFWFGFWDLAVSVYKEMADLDTTVHLTVATVPISFFSAMASLAVFGETGKRKHLTVAKRNRNKVRRAAAIGSQPAAAYLTLLDAETLSMRKSASRASVMGAYCKAIEAASSQQLVHIEALANEREGFFYASRGSRPEAEACFARAVDLYENGWDAHAKTAWLLEKSRIVLLRLPCPPSDHIDQHVGSIIGFDKSSNDENVVVQA